MNFRTLTLVPFLILSQAVAQEISVRIYNPGDSQPGELAEKIEPNIGEAAGKLISHLKEARESDFIFAAGAKPTLKWRVESLTMLSDDVVAVSFTEGHLEVIGIFVRNHRERRWDLKSEIGGKFRVRSFPDPPEEKKAAGGSDNPAAKPSVEIKR